MFEHLLGCWSRIWLVALIGIVAACSSSKQIEYYSLTTAYSAETKTEQSPRKQSVQIRTVSIPDYLDRPSIVSRIGANQLLFSSQHQWAEPLASAIKRNLFAGLDQHLLVVRVQKATYQLTSDFFLDLDIRRFEIVDQQYCLLGAEWVWSDQRVQHYIKHAQIRVPVKTRGYNEWVAACSSAIEQLSQTIAGVINQQE